jgi:hypothetical protein
MTVTETGVKGSIIVVTGVSEVRLLCEAFFIGHFQANVYLLYVK